MCVVSQKSLLVFLPLTKSSAHQVFSTLPQPGGQLCADQLNGVTVNVTPLGTGAFQLDNVPSACMTLSNVLIQSDDGTQGPVPTPMGELLCSLLVSTRVSRTHIGQVFSFHQARSN